MYIPKHYRLGNRVKKKDIGQDLQDFLPLKSLIAAIPFDQGFMSPAGRPWPARRPSAISANAMAIATTGQFPHRE
jgi:hypothetical protein